MGACAVVGLCEQEMDVRSALLFKFEAESPIGRPGIRCFSWVLEAIGWDNSVGIATRYGLLVQDPLL
jgi:hypothetical protein